MIATLIAVSLLTMGPEPALSDPEGTWVLNKAKSDFGTALIPRQLIIRLEETGNQVSIMTLIVDAGGVRISFREYNLSGRPSPHENMLRPVNSDPARSEEWQVTPQGELVIRRLLTTKSRIIPQRLVLDRSTTVE